MRNAECGAGNAECGMRSGECGISLPYREDRVRNEFIVLLYLFRTDVARKVSHRVAQIKRTDVTEFRVFCVFDLCYSVRNKDLAV